MKLIYGALEGELPTPFDSEDHSWVEFIQTHKLSVQSFSRCRPKCIGIELPSLDLNVDISKETETWDTFLAYLSEYQGYKVKCKGMLILAHNTSQWE